MAEEQSQKSDPGQNQPHPEPAAKNNSKAGCLTMLVALIGFIAWQAVREPDQLGVSPRKIAMTCAGFESENPDDLYFDKEEGVFVLMFDDRWQTRIKADGPDEPAAYAELELGTSPEDAEVGALFAASIFASIPDHSKHVAAAAEFVRNHWDGSSYVKRIGDLRLRMDVYDDRITTIHVSGK